MLSDKHTQNWICAWMCVCMFFIVFILEEMKHVVLVLICKKKRGIEYAEISTSFGLLALHTSFGRSSRSALFPLSDTSNQVCESSSSSPLSSRLKPLIVYLAISPRCWCGVAGLVCLVVVLWLFKINCT